MPERAVCAFRHGIGTERSIYDPAEKKVEIEK